MVFRVLKSSIPILNSTLRALDIPYVVAEASLAPKRADGPWALGYQGAVAAVEAASRIISLNPHNDACIEACLDGTAKIVPMRPFLNQKTAIRPNKKDSKTVTLITTAMMRSGDKETSYAVLAKALLRLKDKNWRLEIIGDGPARRRVKALFEGPLADQTAFLGQRSPAEIKARLKDGDLFVWPAINEAYGMAMLEAQAAGLPVIAGESGGVSRIVRHGTTGILTPAGDAGAFAAAVSTLIGDPDQRQSMREQARKIFIRDHSLESASAVLNEALCPLITRRAA